MLPSFDEVTYKVPDSYVIINKSVSRKHLHVAVATVEPGAGVRGSLPPCIPF